ncbi:MAG: type II toxin-antitoxin system RelE/ParE family toxin [Ignavibacteria bacterium]
MKIKLLPSAERDLEEIYDYLYQESPGYAEEFLNKFYSSIKKLERFPRSGKITEMFSLNRAGYRFIKMGNYYIYYKIEESTVYIFRIIHTARDQKKTLR